MFEYSAGWYDQLAILGYMPTEFEQQLSERIAAVSTTRDSDDGLVASILSGSSPKSPMCPAGGMNLPRLHIGSQAGRR